jgi:ankyrin repeat protein
MGSDFSNYHIRSEAQDEVIRAMTRLARGAFHVTRPTQGWISVYEAVTETQSAAERRRLARGLSRRLHTGVLALQLHDSSVLSYLLFDDGTLVDEYDSCPDYFGTVPARHHVRTQGDARRLASLATKAGQSARLARILDRRTRHVFEDERLAKLARALSIRPSRAAASLEDLENVVPTPGRPAARGVDDLFQAIEYEEGVRVVRRLLELGVSANARRNDGESALRVAASLGQTSVVNVLLTAGARDDAALLSAADGRTARVLLRHGADVNHRDASGRTPLWNAVVMGAADLVRVLLQHGADVHRPYRIQYFAPRRRATGTILMFAERGGRADIVRTLRRAGATHGPKS